MSECMAQGWHVCPESSIKHIQPGHYERRIEHLEKSLRDLREAAIPAYKAGQIAAEPFVRAGNVLAEDK